MEYYAFFVYFVAGWWTCTLVKWANNKAKDKALAGKHRVTFSVVVDEEMDAILLLDQFKNRDRENARPAQTTWYDVKFKIEEI